MQFQLTTPACLKIFVFWGLVFKIFTDDCYCDLNIFLETTIKNNELQEL